MQRPPTAPAPRPAMQIWLTILVSCPAPRAAHPADRPAIGRHHRLRPRRRRPASPPHMIESTPFSAPGLAARDRRVDEAARPCRQPPPQLARSTLRRDRGVVDEDRARADPGEGAVVAEADRAQIVVVADAGHHEGRALRRLARVCGHRAAVLGDPGLGLRGGPVVDRHLVALVRRGGPPSDSPSRQGREMPLSPFRRSVDCVCSVLPLLTGASGQVNADRTANGERGDMALFRWAVRVVTAALLLAAVGAWVSPITSPPARCPTTTPPGASRGITAPGRDRARSRQRAAYLRRDRRRRVLRPRLRPCPGPAVADGDAAPHRAGAAAARCSAGRTLAVDELMRRLDLYPLAQAGGRACRTTTTTAALEAYAHGRQRLARPGQRRGAGPRRAGVLLLFQRDQPLGAGRQPRGDEADGRADGHPGPVGGAARPGGAGRSPRTGWPTSCPTRPAPASRRCRNMPALFDAEPATTSPPSRRRAPRAIRSRRSARGASPAPPTPGPPRPARSAAGGTLLANDPHLGFTAPTIWYLARLELATGGVIGGDDPGPAGDAAGAVGKLRLGPHLRLSRRPGRVHRRAQPRATRPQVRTPDGVRSRCETRALDHPDQGRAPGDPRPCSGPTTARCCPAHHYGLAAVTPPGHVAAIGWTLLTGNDRSMTAAMKLMRARSVAEGIAAGEDYVAPAQNVVMVDASHIAMKTVGAMPRRDAGHVTRGPHAGARLGVAEPLARARSLCRQSRVPRPGRRYRRQHQQQDPRTPLPAPRQLRLGRHPAGPALAAT